MRQSVQQQQEARTDFPSKVYYRRQRLVVVGRLSRRCGMQLSSLFLVFLFGVEYITTRSIRVTVTMT